MMRLVFPLRALVVLSATGCGLISADVTRLSFELPAKTYHFDTAMWQLPLTGNVPSVPCTTAADCCVPPGGACTTSELACEGGMCALHKTVVVTQTMTLGNEVPQLHGAHSVADVFISQINYTAASTLNVALPPVAIYLAPAGVMDPSDPTAKKFGTVPASPAHATTNGTVALESDAQQTFAGYAKMLDMPFNFIAATDVSVTAGMPIPSGSVDVSVTGTASVQPTF